MLRKTLIFLVSTASMYAIVSMAFALVCWLGGHNTTEAIYGGWASIVLPLVAGAEALYLSTLP